MRRIFKKLKIVTPYIVIIAMCMVLSACANVLSNGKLQSVLRENGNGYETAKVETAVDLDNSDESSDTQNKLVLVNNNGSYDVVIINTGTNTVTLPAFRYIPLYAVQQEIWKMGKDVNIKDIGILKKYLELYGITGLDENIENSEEYLREITGKDGIISTETARNAISNATTTMFPNVKSGGEVTVLFEENNAVPMFYTLQTSQMVYNWNSIFAEDVYRVWKASTDSQTQQVMQAMYGPPYVNKTVWAVFDREIKKVGNYDSLEEVKNKLASKK